MKKHEIQLKHSQWSKLIALLLLFTVALGGTSCKSKKKIAAEKAAIELIHITGALWFNNSVELIIFRNQIFLDTSKISRYYSIFI